MQATLNDPAKNLVEGRVYAHLGHYHLFRVDSIYHGSASTWELFWAAHPLSADRPWLLALTGSVHGSCTFQRSIEPNSPLATRPGPGVDHPPTRLLPRWLWAEFLFMAVVGAYVAHLLWLARQDRLLGRRKAQQRNLGAWLDEQRQK